MFAGWALLNALVSPLYARFYRYTHSAAFDERHRVAITPPPDRTGTEE